MYDVKLTTATKIDLQIDGMKCEGYSIAHTSATRLQVIPLGDSSKIIQNNLVATLVSGKSIGDYLVNLPDGSYLKAYYNVNIYLKHMREWEISKKKAELETISGSSDAFSLLSLSPTVVKFKIEDPTRTVEEVVSDPSDLHYTTSLSPGSVIYYNDTTESRGEVYFRSTSPSIQASMEEDGAEDEDYGEDEEQLDEELDDSDDESEEED
jgi:hypothetical protein